LQILLLEALLGKLGDDDVKALGSEQGLVLALRLARMDLPQRSERRTKAIDGWREGVHDYHSS
jgi:hypothetical protein